MSLTAIFPKKFRFILLLSFFVKVVVAQQVIGTIDYYGLQTVPKEKISAVIGVKEGDTLLTAPENLLKRLLQIKGVRKAHIEVHCCEAGKSFLFIGVAENVKDTMIWKNIRGAPYYLPDTILKKYNRYLEVLKEAVMKGDNGDDFSEGHSLFRNPEVRKIQKDIIPLADLYFDELARVLQYSTMADQREVAAFTIAYASDKSKVAYQYNKAVTDPSAEVRNNVYRALSALSLYAQSHPEVHIRINDDVFVKLLNSIYWTDRNKAMFALVSLTQNRDKELLRKLKRGALRSLTEMTSWNSSGHAMLAYIILGRILGIADEEIFKTWSENKRSFIIDLAQHQNH